MGRVAVEARDGVPVEGVVDGLLDLIDGHLPHVAARRALREEIIIDLRKLATDTTTRGQHADDVGDRRYEDITRHNAVPFVRVSG